MFNFRILLILIFTSVLTACGSGDSSSDDKAANQQIQFNQDGSITLKVGDELENPVTAEGTGTITYSSSDVSVVVVDEEGNLLANKVGSATINASITADETFGSASASVVINVVKRDRELSIWEGSPRILNVSNQNVNLQVSGYSGATPTFSSSDESVIEVTMADSGYVRAKAPGTATITVTVPANETYNEGSFSFDMSVRDSQTLAFENGSTAVDLQLEQTHNRQAQGAGTGVITYASNNPDIAEVDASGLVTAKTAGIAQITASIAQDDSYMAATASYLVQVFGPKVSFVSEVSATESKTTFTSSVLPFNVYSSRNSGCDLAGCLDAHGYSFNESPVTITDDNAGLRAINYYRFTTPDDLKAVAKQNFYTRPDVTYSAMTEFKQHLWLLGGRMGNNDINYVWRSNDAMHWDQMRLVTPFSGRRGHSAVVHDNKLWVVGGFVVNTFQRSVWSSEDGVNWMQSSEDFPDLSGTNISTVKSFSYKNNLYALVGANRTSGNKLYRMTDTGTWESVSGFSSHYYITSDVQIAVKGDRIIIAANNGALYHSDNGSNWSSTQTVPSSTLNPNNLGGLTLYTYNNKFWAVGNYQKVYSSDDGINWSLETETAQYPRRERASYRVVFDDKLWLMGGTMISSSFATEQQIVDVSKDTWTSVDGKNWTQKAIEGEFGTAAEHELISFNNKLWIIGGRSSSGARTNQTWKSTDGINWRLDRGTQLFPVQSYRTHVSEFDNKLWMLTRNSQSASELYWAEEINDTLVWSKVEADLPFEGRIDHQLLGYKGKLWVLGGTKGNVVYTDVWSSVDGESWEKVTDNWNLVAYEQDIKHHRAIVFNDKMWVVGGTTSTNLSSALVAYSDDGITWHKSNNNAGVRRGHDVAVLGDKLLIYPGGQSNQDGSVYWVDTNAVIYAAGNKYPRFQNLSLHNFNGRVWSIGGYDTVYSYGIQGQIWVSDDGINDWRRVSKGEVELLPHLYLNL